MITSQEFLTWESTAVCVDFKPAYVDMADGNLIAGLLLSQIVFWHLPTSQAQFVRHNGKKWLAKSYRDWYHECRLSRHNVRTGVKCLCNLRLIECDTITNQRLIRLNQNQFLSRWQETTTLACQGVVKLTPLTTRGVAKSDPLTSGVAKLTPLTARGVAKSAIGVANLTTGVANSAPIKERKKEENRYVNDDDIMPYGYGFSQQDTSSLQNDAKLILDLLSEINSTLSKPIGGLLKLANELQAKGHTSSTVGDVWQDCQAAKKPVGAFLFWSKHGYLPFKPKPKPASQLNQQNPVFQALKTLNRQLPPEAKPFVGLPAMADKLNKRQETVGAMRNAWKACKLANNPVGAFVKWVNDGTLPLISPATESPLQTDDQGRVWGGAGIGWLSQK